MKCRKHPTDLSSAVGVCASCLCDRLLAVIAVQAQSQAKKPLQQDRRKSDTQQSLPLPFPRSVSPYISRRKSDNAAAATWQPHKHNQRFYSTPQVRPTGSITIEIKNSRKNIGGRFSSLFLRLFRSKKSEKLDLDLAAASDPYISVDFCKASPERRKNQFRTLNEGIAIGVQRRSCRNRDRGLSPKRQPEDDDAESSGYSSESSQGWKQTPQRTPMRRGGGQGMAGNNRNLSVFCFSPLVRASPNRQWNQKCMPPETVVTGESRVPAKQHLTTAASFCKNRSRKLADMGRYNNNPNY